MRLPFRGMLRAGYRQWRRKVTPVLVTSAGLCTKPLLPLPRECSKLPPWVIVPTTDVCRDSSEILQQLNADADAFKEHYNDDSFKKLFDEKVRWFLVSKLILFERKLNDPEISELHYQNRIRNRDLGYVTSRTLMKCLVKVREGHWMPILQSLVDNRIIVLVDWDKDSEMAPLEVLFFSHGDMLAPQSGTTDCETFKAETDASCFQNMELSGSDAKYRNVKTATTSSIIWNAGNMVDSQAVWGMPCPDSQYAEALGVLNVLKRGKKLPVKIKKIVVVTDNEPNFQVLSGQKDLSTCDHPEVMMAIFQAAKEYEVCTFRWAHRESLSFVDAMCTEANNCLASTMNLKNIMETTGPSCLWGFPTARMNQDRKRITRKMAKTFTSFDEKSFASKSYYVTVPQQKLKLFALEALLTTVDPKLVFILVPSEESVGKVLACLKERYPCVAVKRPDQDDLDICRSNEREALILVNESNIPKFSTEKVLLVTFGIPAEQICYAPRQDIFGVVKVHIILPDEKDALPDAAEEVNPFMYPFFRETKGKGASVHKKHIKGMDVGITNGTVNMESDKS